jgi:hypothetical protein
MSLGIGLGIPFRSQASAIPFGGLLPPSGYLQWLKGGTTDGLTLIDAVGTLSAPAITDVPCLALDDASCKTAFTFPAGNFDLTVLVSQTSSQSGGSIFKTIVGGNVDLSGGGAPVLSFTRDYIGVLEYSYGCGSQFRYSTGASLGTWLLLRMWCNGTTGYLSVNGNTVATHTLGAKVNDHTELSIGDSAPTGSGRFGNIHISRMRLNTGTGSVEYHFNESSGLTAYDVSGNGNHGTISATGATWTTASGIPSYAAQYGFRQSGAVQIPALLDGSAAADGNPITNPAGNPCNGSGTKIKQTDFGIVQVYLTTVGGMIEQTNTLLSKDPVDKEGSPYYATAYVSGAGYTDIYKIFGVWTMVNAGGDTSTNPATTTFPPKTGWTNAGGFMGTPSLAYDSFWIEAGEFIARSQAEIEAHNADTDATRSSVKSPAVLDILTYADAPTGTDLDQLNAYIDHEEV